MSNQGMGKVMLVLGGILMIAGGVLLALHHRVLATCFLEVVVTTIQPQGSPPIESHDFSWGRMVFGRMDSDFAKMIFGLVVLGLAQCLLLPLALRGATNGGVNGSVRLSRMLLVGAGFFSLLAAGAVALIALITYESFSALATSGAADPQMLGDGMPIKSSHGFAICLILVQALIFPAAWAGAVREQPMSWARSIPCLIPSLLFVGLMLLIKIAPFDAISGHLKADRIQDPAVFAGHISRMIFGYGLGAALLAFSAVAILVMALVGKRPKDVVAG